MALWKYDGIFAEVEVRIAGESYGTVEKGGSVVIPDEVAAEAGFSDDWSEVKSKSKSNESKDSPAEEVPVDVDLKESE